MADLQPVPAAPSRIRGREGPVAVALGLALFLAILKPWGPGPGRLDPTPSASPSPPAAKASSSTSRDSGFDAGLFGPFEPAPEWSIWPAGYFVSVMYVARAPRSPAGPSLAPSATAEPGADWPSMIEIGPEDHLLWLGIDTPRGWSLDAAVLRRLDRDGVDTVVATRMLDSPWPSHFSVLALAPVPGETTLAVWPAGDYRLELRASPGAVRRTLEIRIQSTPHRRQEVDRPGAQR